MRLSSFWALFIILLTGCNKNEYRVPVAAVDRLPPPSPSRSLRKSADDREMSTQEERLNEPLSSSQVVSGQTAGSGATSAPAGPDASLPAPASSTEADELIDIEARYAIACESVTSCASRLRETARAYKAAITLDESQNTGRQAEATLELRIPAQEFERLAGDLGKLGEVRTREVVARDITKQYHDAELLYSNLLVARRRYEELLAKATSVPDILTIEKELERLRARMDQIKGDMLWMRDRAARATVRVRFFATPTSEDVPLATRSAFYPSLRAVSLFDARGESEVFGYLGGGLGLGWHGESGEPRALVLEFDVARAALTDRPPSSNYVYMALAGVDMYSDLLGGGRRRWLNPYLGLRVGYAQSQGSGDLAFGALVGLDIFKSRNIILELALRSISMIGNDKGIHLMVGPSLGFDFAF